MGFELTGGEASDGIQFKPLMQAGPVENPRAIVADKGYDSDANREMARGIGALPVIPYRSNRKHIPERFAKALYRGRARIEHMIGKLKRFKRIALRCEKNGAELQGFRSPRCNLRLDQIRPHRLAPCVWATDWGFF